MQFHSDWREKNLCVFVKQVRTRSRMTLLNITSNVNFCSQKNSIFSNWEQKIYSTSIENLENFFSCVCELYGKSLIINCSVPHPFRGNFISPTVRPLPAILQALLKFVSFFKIKMTFQRLNSLWNFFPTNNTCFYHGLHRQCHKMVVGSAT